MSPAVSGNWDALDASRPNPARVYDHFLGGKDTYAADREEAARIEAALGPPAPGHLPVPQEIALRNRLFLDRAVSWAARNGARQVLDLGCGFPVSGRVIKPPGADPVTLRGLHEAAGDGGPGARCAYVDHDPVVTSHTSALAADGTKIMAVLADLSDPAAVLSDPGVRECLDLRRPACVVLGSVLQSFPPDEARAITGAYTAAVAPGSALVISCPRTEDGELRETAREACTVYRFWDHPAAEVASFFAGTRIMAPGVVPARGWNAGWRDFVTPDGPAYVLVGLGVKR